MSPAAAPSVGEDNLADMVIVICGPIASGKSTVARALAQLLERQGLGAATIDLDLVYEMLQTDGSAKSSRATWCRARRAAAGLTDVLLREGVDVVIAEGDFLTSEERADYVDALASDDQPRFVTMRVLVDIALDRVQGDASRSLSRDPDFLRRHYEQVDGAMRTRPETDLVIDASSVGIQDAASAISRWASRRRDARVAGAHLSMRQSLAGGPVGGGDFDRSRRGRSDARLPRGSWIGTPGGGGGQHEGRGRRSAPH